MLVELEGGEVILRFEDENFRPDDRLPNRQFAKEFVAALGGIDEELKQRFLDSKWRRSFRHPRGPEAPRKTLGTKVSAETKKRLREIAARNGMSLSAYVAEMLEITVMADAARCDDPKTESVPSVLMDRMSLADARASVALDKDPECSTQITEGASE